MERLVTHRKAASIGALAGPARAFKVPVAELAGMVDGPPVIGGTTIATCPAFGS